MNTEINTIEKALRAMSMVSSDVTDVDDLFRWQMLRLALSYVAIQLGCDLDKKMNK